MEGNQRYFNSYMKIERAMEKNIKVIEAVTKNFEQFLVIIKNQISTISKIPTLLPNKGAKKNIFTRVSDVSEMYDIDQLFEAKWNSIECVFLRGYPGFPVFLDLVQTHVIDLLKSSYAEYKLVSDLIKSKHQMISDNFRNIEDIKNKADNNYRNYCRQMETLQKKISTTNQGKNPDAYQKLVNSFIEMKSNFPSVQAEVQSSIVNYNYSLIQISSQYEFILEMFEEIEKKRDSVLSQVMNEMEIIFRDYSKSKFNASQLMKEITSNMASHEDFDSFFEKNNIKPINQDQAYNVEFHPSIPPFNISEYLDPMKIFENEMLFKGALVVSSFHATNSDELDVVSGMIVKIKGTKQSMSLVSVLDDEKSGYVPSSCLLEAPELQRRLYKLKEIHQAQESIELDANKGEVVLSIRTEPEYIVCMNSFSQIGNIPVSKLVPF